MAFVAGLQRTDHFRGRDRVQVGDALHLFGALVVAEEEELILYDRPTYGAAKLFPVRRGETATPGLFVKGSRACWSLLR